jgi:hypothetical protein
MRRRPPRRAAAARRLALAIVTGSALVPARAHAQFAVAQVQPLAFGYLTQGITEVVPYTDTFRRGVVNVDGSGQVWIRVTLPPSLVSAQGASIPLQFLTGDVAAQESGRPAAAFDPSTSTRVNLGKGTATLFIGGRAVPAANQPAGVYSATMTVLVSSTKF